MRIGGIRVEGTGIGGIRIGGIRFEWICVGYVWCDGYVWDMCGGEICVGYVWCEIRQQSSEEPCDETSFGKNTRQQFKVNDFPKYTCLIAAAYRFRKTC